MKMDFLNICYKLFNRFIVVNELIDMLSNFDKDNKDINYLVDEIKKIEKDNPNTEDEYINKEKEMIKNLIDKIEYIPKDAENMEFITKELNNLKDDYNRQRDSYDRWSAVAKCIADNEYFNECFDNLSDPELLEFITQYIHAPYPPKIEQDKFDRLVKVGIENDDREALWRLAFNYYEMDINLDSIVDYFIDKKDGYYLSELISAVGESLNIDIIFGRIDDKDLINDLLERKKVIDNYVTEEQFNKLEEKLK